MAHMQKYSQGIFPSRKLADPLAEVVTKIVRGKSCKNITFDNGKEFARYQEMAEALGTNIYFTHPHSPWERGTNENTNELLQQFFPKGKSMAHVSQEGVDVAVHLLNNRPPLWGGLFREFRKGTCQGCRTGDPGLPRLSHHHRGGTDGFRYSRHLQREPS